VPQKTDQDKSPCTDCISTDFVVAAKVCPAQIAINVTAGLVLPSPLMDVASFVPASTFFNSRPPLFVAHRILRV
jgi:hypothetical protein